QEIHDALMASPGHAANIMNRCRPDSARVEQRRCVTHVGIGAVAEPGAAGGIVVTEDFIEVLPTTDVSGAPAQILAAVNQRRGTRGGAPLVVRPRFAQIAQQEATAFFQNGALTQDQVAADVNRQLGRDTLAYSRILATTGVFSHVEEAEGLEPLLDS